MSTALLTGGNKSSALSVVPGFDILEHNVLHINRLSYPFYRKGMCLQYLFGYVRPNPECG